MNEIEKTICEITGATQCEFVEAIQELWSGYGLIQRITLDLADHSTAIVKHIDISESRENLRGWSGNVSHQRKVRSYQVEMNFYESYSQRCGTDCRLPQLIASREMTDDSGWLIVLEDLDGASFDIRKSTVSQPEIRACISWLAHFHGTFLSENPAGLWPVGTYWHLETRPDEFNSMPNSPLKNAAREIDRQLNDAKFQTLVHGDAKLANFCFSLDYQVAAVDFQYVGAGCGMKDLVYFISSCLNESESESQQDELLDFYFQELEKSIALNGSEIDCDALQLEWRRLFPFAWADFYRFLAGWSPGHWKINQYNNRITQSVVDQLSK